MFSTEWVKKLVKTDETDKKEELDHVPHGQYDVLLLNGRGESSKIKVCTLDKNQLYKISILDYPAYERVVDITICTDKSFLFSNDKVEIKWSIVDEILHVNSKITLFITISDPDENDDHYITPDVVGSSCTLIYPSSKYKLISIDFDYPNIQDTITIQKNKTIKSKYFEARHFTILERIHSGDIDRFGKMKRPRRKTLYLELKRIGKDGPRLWIAQRQT